MIDFRKLNYGYFVSIAFCTIIHLSDIRPIWASESKENKNPVSGAVQGNNNTQNQVPAGSTPDPAPAVAQALQEVLINLPHVRAQDDGWSCGLNSATRLMRHHGIPINYSYAKVHGPKGNILGKAVTGPIAEHLVGFMNAQAPADQEFVLEKKGTIENLKQKLRNGKPVLVLTTQGGNAFLGIPFLHYFVVNGFNPSTNQICYMETKNYQCKTSVEAFEKMWDAPLAGIVGVPISQPRLMISQISRSTPRGGNCTPIDRVRELTLSEEKAAKLDEFCTIM